MNAAPPVASSPCQKKCCLDDNDICLGCFRSLDEITRWVKANTEERLEIIIKAKSRKSFLDLRRG